MLKIRQFMALLTALAIAVTPGFSVAKASIFDWLSGSEFNASGNPVFGFVASYLNTNSQLPGNNQENAEGLPISQNNSLLTNPIKTTKTQKNQENRSLDQGTSVKKTTEQIKELVVPATAYSSTPDQTDDTPFITALGTTVRDGIVAANFLPFGTKIKIPDIYGDKIFVVEDRMNRRYWHRVDIWFPDRASALEFGIKKIKIQILES